MPTCRECHSRISKFDKDRCPVCGCLNPLDGGTSETIEITQNFDFINENKSYKPTRKLTLFLLFFFLGFTGAPFFYMKRKKLGLISLLCSLFCIGVAGSALAFATNIGIVWGYVIPVVVIYLINIVFGLILTFKDNVKDGNGEFLK